VRRDPAGLVLRRRLDSTKPRAVQSLQDSRGASQPGFEPERRIPLHLPLVSPRSVRFTPQPWLLVTCRCHHGTGSRRPPSGCVPTGTGTSGSIACQTMSFTSLSSARMMVGDLHLVVGLGCTRHQNRTTRRSVDGLLLLDVPGPNPICYLRGLFEVALFT